MKRDYVEQLVIGGNNDDIYVKNIYQFYSKKQKKKLVYKYKKSNILGFDCFVAMPPIKLCKKDRFIRVCKNINKVMS